jgi:RND family efflux transporter MFP subunit
MNQMLALPILAAALWLAACDKQPPAVESTATTVEATVTTVREEAIQENYVTTGSLIADDRIDIASRIMGFIRSVDVHEGSQVKKGQLLLTIDPTEIQAQLAEAEARVTQSQAQLAEAESDLERYRALYEQKMISVDRFRKAELAMNLARGGEQAAQAALNRIKVQMQYANIHSPVSGVIVARHKQAGDIATPGAPLLTIENPENVVVRTFVKEQQLQHIRIGDQAGVSIEAAALTTTGTITQIVPSADPGTHSYLVKISLAEHGQARTGMFARVNFETGHTSGILIPASAVISRADLNGVYIVDADNIAHYRLVRLGRHFQNGIEVLTGIEAGDRIVVDHPATISSGDHIISADGGAAS